MCLVYAAFTDHPVYIYVYWSIQRLLSRRAFVESKSTRPISRKETTPNHKSAVDDTVGFLFINEMVHLKILKVERNKFANLVLSTYCHTRMFWKNTDKSVREKDPFSLGSRLCKSIPVCHVTIPPSPYFTETRECKRIFQLLKSSLFLNFFIYNFPTITVKFLRSVAVSDRIISESFSKTYAFWTNRNLLYIFSFVYLHNKSTKFIEYITALICIFFERICWIWFLCHTKVHGSPELSSRL